MPRDEDILGLPGGDEYLRKLAQSRGFDIGRALEDGVPKEAILKHLESAAPKPRKPKKEVPTLTDWAGAWWDGFTAPLRYGRDDPRTREAQRKYQEIDTQTVAPVAKKASDVASAISFAVFVGQGSLAAYDAFRIAKSQFGNLSPSVNAVKKGLSAIIGGPEKPIQQALDGKITPTQAADKLRKFRNLNPDRLEKAVKDLKDLAEMVKSKGRSPLPSLETLPTIAGTSVGISPEKPPTSTPTIPPAPTATALPGAGQAAFSPPSPPGPPRGEGILSGERGSIRLESLVPGADELENISLNWKDMPSKAKRLFTRFQGLDERTTQIFINFQEADGIMREDAARAAISATGHLSEEDKAIVYRHLQRPSEPIPFRLLSVAEELNEVAKRSLVEINRPYLSANQHQRFENAVMKELPIPGDIIPKVPRYPDNQIRGLEERIRVLDFRIANTENAETKLELQAQLENAQRRKNSLEGVRYFHQVSRLPRGVRRAGAMIKSKTLSARPKGLLGRKFATVEEAQKAGFETADLTGALADMLYETERSVMTHEFISSINRNPDFSQRSDIAPEGWKPIDHNIFPAGNFRKYHPAIAEAIKELLPATEQNAMMRAYDAVNTTSKMVGFYNPLFMTRFNASQGFRAAGFGHFKALPEAVKIFREKGDTYKNLRSNGLFNNVFNHTEMVTEITDNMLRQLNNTNAPERFKQIAKEVLDPINLLRNTYQGLNKATWKADEIQRIATWLALKKIPRIARGYNDFQIIELANDFHANYGKVPNQTRKALNRAMFTPTYKISMARALGRMWTEPKKLWPQLLRHYAMKIAFSLGIPLAMREWYKMKGLDKTIENEDYKFVVRDGRDQTVYSISDPILEEKKLLTRPVKRTVEYNLSAALSGLVNLVRGPLFDDPDKPEWQNTLDAFFKTGAPIVKELSIWKDRDLDSHQKFMQLLGLAYIYKRNWKTFSREEQEKLGEKMMKMLDLWVDYKKWFPEKKKKETRKIYRRRGK